MTKDATYIGPPVRVREIRKDGSVRLFTTVRIEEGEELVITDLPALDEQGNFLDEEVVKADDQPAPEEAKLPGQVFNESGVPTASPAPDAKDEKKAAKKADSDIK